MRRTRTVNSSPERSSAMTVEVLTELITTSLAHSKVPAATVTEALEVARPALLILVSGRHLRTHPVVLAAADTVCEFYCRHDDAAVGGEENLNPVPGLGTAVTFTLYLPASGHLSDTIADIVATNDHLCIEPAPTQAESTKTAAHTATERTAGGRVAAAAGPLDLASLEGLL